MGQFMFAVVLVALVLLIGVYVSTGINLLVVVFGA